MVATEKLRNGSLILAVICTVAAVLPAHGHHSQGIYDISRSVTLEGTIQQVRWIFPHAWIYMDVEDEGGETNIWVLEGASPPSIEEAGVSREDVRPGDRVSVRCHPLKDGSEGCVLGYVTPMHGDMARGHGVERPWN